MSVPAAELDLSDEEMRVVDWRICQLERLGLSREQVNVLACETSIPLGDVRRLIRAGCSPHLAVRILL